MVEEMELSFRCGPEQQHQPEPREKEEAEEDYFQLTEQEEEHEDEEQTESILLNLPPEIMMDIFTCLDVRAILSFSSVSRCWRTIIDDELLWKTAARRDMGALVTKQDSETWYQAYRRHASWAWSETAKHNKIVLSNQNKTASHVGSGSYHSVRTNHGILRGVHYFELRIEAPSQSIAHSIGIANNSYIRSWVADNKGIGWYRDGNVYIRGIRCPVKFPSWNGGDVLGIMADLDQHTLHFYKNGEKFPHRITIERAEGEALHVAALLGGSESVSLGYHGHSSPSQPTNIMVPRPSYHHHHREEEEETPLDDATLAMLVSMGFEPADVVPVLRRCRNDAQRAVEELLANAAAATAVAAVPYHRVFITEE
ncbi:negative regulation of Ras protein signal transduction [Balamuthia mandrillaris]